MKNKKYIHDAVAILLIVFLLAPFLSIMIPPINALEEPYASTLDVESAYGEIRVFVKDEKTGRLLGGVSIYLDGEYKGKTITRAGTPGQFSGCSPHGLIIKDVPAGTHTIEAKLTGYYSKKVSGNVPAGGIWFLEMTLRRIGDKYPDLIITDISWDPSEPKDGDVVTFTVNVRNIGEGVTVNVGNFCINASEDNSFSVDCFMDGRYMDYGIIGALSPGASSSISFTWKASVGSHRVEFLVDSNDEVIESDEGNNRRIVTLYVEPANEPPIASLEAWPTVVYAGEIVNFDASSSYDPDGQVTSYFFDFGDGHTSGWISSSKVSHSYPEPGTYYARARVRDDDGAESEWSSSVKIEVKVEEYVLEPYDSDYKRDGQQVFFCDELAKKYAPIFYVKEGAEPAPLGMEYRIIKDGDKYVIQYLQIYPLQKGWKKHFFDYSLVLIHLNEDLHPISITYDSGVSLKRARAHASESRSWSDVPKEEDHPKLLIKDKYHTMKLPTDKEIRAAVKLVYPDDIIFARMTDDRIRLWYSYADIGSFNKYMNGLGWDVTSSSSATQGTGKELDLEIKATISGDNLHIEIETERNSVVSMWITEGVKSISPKLTVYMIYYEKEGYKLDRGLPLESGNLVLDINTAYDVAEYLDFPSGYLINLIPLGYPTGKVLWVVVHRATGRGVHRVVKYVRIVEATELISNYLFDFSVEVSSEVDLEMNEDLSSNFLEYGTSVENELIIQLGGPLRYPGSFWKECGVEFRKIGGYYRALVSRGEAYEAKWGEEDYCAIIIRDVDGKVIVNVAGITRFGTRAGLLWLLNNKDEIKDATVIVLKWKDKNHNDKVELSEIVMISRH